MKKIILLLLLAHLFDISAAEAATSCNPPALGSNQAVTKVETHSSCPVRRYTLKTLNPTSGGTQWICNHNVPPGWVVYEKAGTNDPPSIDCSGGPGVGKGIRYRVRRPSATSGITTMCATGGNHQIPSGYVVIEKGDSSNCTTTSGTQPTYRIRIPTSSTSFICSIPGNGHSIFQSGSNLPVGWVVTDNNRLESDCDGERRWDIELASSITSNTCVCTNQTPLTPLGLVPLGTSGCSASQCDGPEFRIGPPQHNQFVCGTSTVPPAGFVTIEVDTVSNCAPGAGGQLGYKIFSISQIGSAGRFICGSSTAHVPPGFVVTQVTSSTTCSAVTSAPSLYIEAASNGDTICSNLSTIPSGFGVTSSQQSSNCSSTGTGPSYTIEQFQEGNFYCDVAGAPVPTGWVVTQVVSNTSCPTNVALKLEQLDPVGPNTVCESPSNVSNLPNGYVITTAEIDQAFCGIARTKYTVELAPSDGEVIVCDESPIPQNYVVIRTIDPYPACDTLASQQKAKVIRPPQGNSFDICIGSPIPAGYVITAVKYRSTCGGSPGTNNTYTIELPNAAGETTICESSPIPPEYVITQYTTSTACGGEDAYKIVIPDPTGSTITCSDPPAGFIVVGTVPTTNCGLQPTANVIRSSQFILPNVEVNPIKNVTPGTVTPPAYNCSTTTQNPGFVSKSSNGANCNQ